MPEGRAERAVEAPAKSIDGAEHNGMIKGVMAIAEIDSDDDRASGGRNRARSWSRSPIQPRHRMSL